LSAYEFGQAAARIVALIRNPGASFWFIVMWLGIIEFAFLSANLLWDLWFSWPVELAPPGAVWPYAVVAGAMWWLGCWRFRRAERRWR